MGVSVVANWTLPTDRTPTLRPPIVLAVAALVVSACSVVASSPVAVGLGIAVSPKELRPVDQCLLEAGFRASEVHPARQGTVGGHAWETETWFSWRAAGPGATAAAMGARRDRFVQSRPKTDAELREIYDRWVAERECLVGLGFDPTPPPPFEDWLVDWRTTGPWMPIDGLNFELTTGPSESLKEQCGLEMVD